MAKLHFATLSTGSSPESSFEMKTEMLAQYSHTQKKTICPMKVLQHMNTLLIKLLHLEMSSNQALKTFLLSTKALCKTEGRVATSATEWHVKPKRGTYKSCD